MSLQRSDSQSLNHLRYDRSGSSKSAGAVAHSSVSPPQLFREKIMAVAPLIVSQSKTTYTASKADMLELWGNLRSLMHARHIEVDVAAELLQEILEAFPNHAKDYATAYATQLLSQRARQREVHSELSELEAPTLWSDDSDRMRDHVHASDQIIALDLEEELGDEDDDWALEREEWYWEEMTYFNIFDDYQGEHPARDCRDLMTHYTASAYIEHDEDGYLRRVFVRMNDTTSIYYQCDEIFSFEDDDLHPLTEYFPMD